MCAGCTFGVGVYCVFRPNIMTDIEWDGSYLFYYYSRLGTVFGIQYFHVRYFHILVCVCFRSLCQIKDCFSTNL